MANTPHKHADLIKAWADGAEIEFYDRFSKEWRVPTVLTWEPATEYRIKSRRQKEKDAFEKGAQIEILMHWNDHGRLYDTWELAPSPSWDEDAQYRIKPKGKWEYIRQAVLEGKNVQYLSALQPTEWRSLSIGQVYAQSHNWQPNEKYQWRIEPKWWKYWIAYKAGKQVQVYSKAGFEWVNLIGDLAESNFYEDYEYRLKPEETEFDKVKAAYERGEVVQFKIWNGEWRNNRKGTDNELDFTLESSRYRLKPTHQYQEVEDAWKEGKPIQIKFTSHGNGQWVDWHSKYGDLYSAPNWDYDEWRIKPDPFTIETYLYEENGWLRGKRREEGVAPNVRAYFDDGEHLTGIEFIEK